MESGYFYKLRRAPKSDPLRPMLSNLVISVEGGSFFKQPKVWHPLGEGA